MRNFEDQAWIAAAKRLGLSLHEPGSVEADVAATFASAGPELPASKASRSSWIMGESHGFGVLLFGAPDDPDDHRVLVRYPCPLWVPATLTFEWGGRHGDTPLYSAEGPGEKAALALLDPDTEEGSTLRHRLETHRWRAVLGERSALFTIHTLAESPEWIASVGERAISACRWLHRAYEHAPRSSQEVAADLAWARAAEAYEGAYDDAARTLTGAIDGVPFEVHLERTSTGYATVATLASRSLEGAPAWLTAVVRKATLARLEPRGEQAALDVVELERGFVSFGDVARLRAVVASPEARAAMRLAIDGAELVKVGEGSLTVARLGFSHQITEQLERLSRALRG
jgi:hypothetical protein